MRRSRKICTSFANSDGGVLIYGVEETDIDGRPCPGSFDPISLNEVSRDQLTQIISANSEPTIPGFRVIPVKCPGQSDDSKVCFVVVIPKSDTAHMAPDRSYHFRQEATTCKMRDWQVRDVMNRSKTPRFRILGRKRLDINSNKYPRIEIRLDVSNASEVIARQYRIKVTLPNSIQQHHASTEAWMTGEGPRRGASLGRVEGMPLLITENEGGPFYPGHVRTINARLDLRHASAIVVTRLQQSITETVGVEIFADNMPRFFEELSLEAMELTAEPLW